MAMLGANSNLHLSCVCVLECHVPSEAAGSDVHGQIGSSRGVAGGSRLPSGSWSPVRGCLWPLHSHLPGGIGRYTVAAEHSAGAGGHFRDNGPGVVRGSSCPGPPGRRYISLSLMR